MNKKVCHITSAHSRYDVRIFVKECQSLANSGYDVTLIVNDDKNDETIEGIKIVSSIFKPKNRLDRFINSNKRIFEKAIKIEADIYHLHDPDLLSIGNKLKRQGKKVIFDSHEDIPMQIKDKQWIPSVIRNSISKCYELYEKYSVRNYDAVISVTPHIIERFSKINLNSIMITNYPIVNANEEILRNPINAICFAGGISEQWSHKHIILAIEEIEDIKYILAGNGPKEYMDSLKKLTAWDKVQYKGKIPHSEVEKIYSQSLAGVALNYSNQAKGEGTLGNTKLFEFMEAKLPIICSDYKLWKDIIQKNNCGICIDPRNQNEIKKAVEYILKNPKEAILMGENGRNVVLEKYNWHTQEKELIKLYRKL